jgi:hypothetical protein
MEFRIGVNLGDVMVDGEQIYGDGVNVAARLESLAEPGGICISGTVHEHLANKLALAYEDLGEQAVKNIAKPVRVLRVMLDGEAATRTTAKPAERPLRKHWRGGALSLVGLAIIVGTIVLVQHLSLRPPATNAAAGPDSWRNREFRPTPRAPGFGIGRRGPSRALSCTFCGKIWRELPSPQREGVNSMIQDIKSKALDLGIEPDRKTVRQGLDNEARRAGYRGGYSGDPDRLARA